MISYYGEAQGSPVSAVYTIKFADLDTPKNVQTVENINATAGGTEAKGNGRNWFKFYPLEVKNPSENGYSSLKFRFDKLK